MRLLIISHTEHYLSGSAVVGWGATIREIDQLASLFDEVVHLAPLHPQSPPPSALPYHSQNIRFRSVHPAGGDHLWRKIGILMRLPEYISVMLTEMRSADVVHVRHPAAISLIALLLLILLKQPARRWFKYAGNWSPHTNDALSYRIQRRLLSRKWHSGVVTITGSDVLLWPHTQVLANPCLTDEELADGTAVVKALSDPIYLLYVGRVEEAKGIGRAIEIVRRLHNHGSAIRLDVVGDSPHRLIFERAATDLSDIIQFHGEKTREELNEFYRRAHFLLLPSTSEGWPKVLSEGMAYGVVPIASDVGSIRSILTDLGVGATVSVSDIDAYIDAIERLVSSPESWQRQSEQAKQVAYRFTYRAYLENIRNLLRIG